MKNAISRQGRMAVLISSSSSGGNKRASVIRNESLYTLIGQFVLDVKAVPWGTQVELFVRNRLQGLALCISCRVLKIGFWQRKIFCLPLFQNLGGNSHQFGTKRHRVEQMLNAT